MKEETPRENIIEIIENGPIKITGKIILSDQKRETKTEETEVYLCRCGRSANKPFCDGSHKRHQ